MNTLGVSPHSRGNRQQKPRYDLKNVHYNLEFSKFKLINFAWLDPRSTNQLSNSGINQSLIRLTCLGRKSRDGIAKVSAVELRIFVDLSREETLAERAIGN